VSGSTPVSDPASSATGPEVSIVVPTFNRRDLLQRQIGAIRRQSSSVRWELVVVDNGSTDGTAAWVQALVDQDSRIRYVSATDESGAAYARNVGAHAARAPLLAFADDDDVVGEGWLEALMIALEDHDLVACRMDYDLLNRPEIARFWPRTQETALGRDDDGRPVCNAAIGIRRSTWLALGGQRSGILVGEDVDLSQRAAREMSTSATFAPAAVYHRQLPATVAECLRDGIRSGRSRVRTAAPRRGPTAAMSDRHSSLGSLAWLVGRLPYVFGSRRYMWARRCGQVIGAWRESWRRRPGGA